MPLLQSLTKSLRTAPVTRRPCLAFLPAFVLGVAGLGLFSAGLSGCGQVNGSTQTQYAQLRVIDTSTTAGGVDIHIGTSVLTYNIGFGSIVNYTPVLPGTYTINADQSGSTSVLTSIRASLVAGTQYTLLLTSPTGTLTSQLLTDQSQPAPGSQSLVRLIDQASQIGAVDVYFIPSGGSLLTSKPVATDVMFNTILNGLTVPTNTYQIELLPTGTVPSAATSTTAATTALYTSSATSFPAGSARTILLLDTQVTTTPAVQVVIVDDYGT